MAIMDRDQKPDNTFYPTHAAGERAVKGETPKRRRRSLNARVPADVALRITGIPGPGGGLLADKDYAIALPRYPDLPKHPAEPTGGSEAEWKQFNQDYDAYWSAWKSYQKETAGLRDTPELTAALAHYTGKSTARALEGEGNRVYSPVSLWFAMAMLAETTGGETRQQVLDALGAPNVDQLRNWADILWHTLYQDNGTATTLLGISIWLNKRMSVYPDTLKTLAESYQAGSFQVPMGTAEADGAISRWVSEQTRGLIWSDGKVMATEPNTMAVVAATLYYQSRWNDEFAPEQTKKAIFTAADGTETVVNFMHKTQDTSFLRQNGYQAASLGTSNGMMTFVLPDKGISPADLLAEPDFLWELTDSEGRIYGEVRWSVPKFDVSSDLDLISTLTSMGLTDVLEGKTADFTPLTDTEPVWLDQARQIARVKVDEEGVEATAVTLMADETSAPPVEDPTICIMNLNRPFLFVIRNGSAILFVGVVEQV